MIRDEGCKYLTKNQWPKLQFIHLSILSIMKKIIILALKASLH